MSNAPSDSPSPAAPESPEEKEVTQPRRKSTGGWVVAMLVVLIVGGIVALYFAHESIAAQFPVFERALLTLITLAGGLTVITLVCGWIVFLSRASAVVRVLAVLFWLTTTIGIPAAIKPVNTGDMTLASWRWRWEKDPDQLLVEPEIATNLVVDFADVDANMAQVGRSTDPPTANPEKPRNFPQFLGPNRNGTLGRPAFSADWESKPPRELWKQEIGAGWSGFAAANGFAVTLEQRGPDELTTCYDIETGDVVWFHTDTARHNTIAGGIGPRSTPTIHEGKVYSIGANGNLNCLKDSSGEVLWSKDILKEVGTTVAAQESLVTWGRAGSPLIYNELVIVPGGGQDDKFDSLIAYNKDTGEEVWRAGDSQISYASPTVIPILGEDHIVSVNEADVSGYDPKTGKELWSYPRAATSNAASNTSQPYNFGGQQILLTKGYGLGSELIQIHVDGDRYQAKQVWQNRRALQTKFTNVVVHHRHIFGLSNGVLECVEGMQGEIKWKKGRFGHGQLLLVDQGLLVLSENGELSHVSTSTEGMYKWTGFDALDGVTWNTICVYGDKVLLRNAEMVGCWQLPLYDYEENDN